MKVTYDEQADAAYIYIASAIGPGEARSQEVTKDGLILDFDAFGRLLGIEVLEPKRLLRPSTLDEAIRK